MPLPQQQRGLTKLSLLLVLAIAGFLLLFAFRIVPPYVDDYYIQAALRSLGDKHVPEKVTELSDREIRKRLASFFTINNVRSQNPKDVEIERERGRILVIMDYEVRVPLIYNIDLVVSFYDVWDSSRPNECCKPDSE